MNAPHSIGGADKEGAEGMRRVQRGPGREGDRVRRTRKGRGRG